MVGLVRALGERRAIIVGHDWGSPVAWHCALLRPDLFTGVALLSVPYIQRAWSDPRPTEMMRLLAGEQQFYQLYFQEPGKAEAELEADIRASLATMLYSASGDPPPERRWRFLFDKSERFLTSGTMPETLPPWLTEHDLDVFTAAFERSGFHGGLNWYRNLDRLWELTRCLCGAPVRQPSLFIAGAEDAVITMYRMAFDALEETMPNLRQKVLLPDAGHWIQQERPVEVNRLLLDFLASL
jgi:pimeloyl-ACP methyl ester carboxylesterase